MPSTSRASTSSRAKSGAPGEYADGSQDVALDFDVPQQPTESTSDNGGRMTTGATAVAWAECPDCRGTVGLIRGTVHLMWRQHDRRIGRVGVPCRRSGTAVCEQPPTGGALAVRHREHGETARRTVHTAATCNGMHARAELAAEAGEVTGGAA